MILIVAVSFGWATERKRLTRELKIEAAVTRVFIRRLSVDPRRPRPLPLYLDQFERDLSQSLWQIRRDSIWSTELLSCWTMGSIEKNVAEEHVASLLQRHRCESLEEVISKLDPSIKELQMLLSHENDMFDRDVYNLLEGR